MEDNKQVDSLV